VSLQIKTIKDKSKAIIEDIKQYLENNTEKVEDYTCDIAMKKDELQQLYDSTNHSVVHSRNAELIRKTNDDIKSLKLASQTEAPQFLITEKKLYPQGNFYGIFLLLHSLLDSISAKVSKILQFKLSIVFQLFSVFYKKITK